MGIYLNPGSKNFQKSINSKIYVDKSELIRYTNSVLDTRQQFICVSRPRRFGKTMAAEMLAAYYCRDCDASELFKGLKAERLPDFKEHLNKHNVIMINIQQFLSDSNSIDEMLMYIREDIIDALRKKYPNLIRDNETRLSRALDTIYTQEHDHGFIFIIDEWDCIFRENRGDIDAQKKYLDFMRNLLKDRSYVDLVYMTGILPIKKYGSHSALNMFTEVSMTDPQGLEEFMGFTEAEVKELCAQYNVEFSEMKRWYDGYYLEGMHIYNPKSVVDSLLYKNFRSYWTRTETYEALKIYLDLNFDGLKESVVSMIGGNRCKINPLKFSNDMTTFSDKDDVMTLLVHLGYLAYDTLSSEVFIPNEEIRGEFINATDNKNWSSLVTAISDSETLLEAIWNGDEAAVASGIEKVHSETTSILQYNSENALSCTISLALYSARNYYTLIRELPTGRGFADIVFLPRHNIDKPAIVAELKWNKSAETAIDQIKNKNYIQALDGYSGEIILVGISYEKGSNTQHKCVIEKITLRHKNLMTQEL